jgi:branched-chain amino acid transport system permease protein
LQALGPVSVIEIIIEGLGTAGLYVMIASGLSLVFGLMGVLNFAHGAVTSVGAYVAAGALFVVATPDASGVMEFLPLVLAALIVFGILFLVGGAVEYGLIRRIYERPAIDQILLTFGVALVIEQVLSLAIELMAPERLGIADIPTTAQADWADPEAYGPELVETGSEVVLGPVSVSGLAAFEIVVGAIVTAAVWAFLTQTRYGLYIRAGSEDDEMAEALGINIRRVFTVVFAIGVGLAGVAGMILIWDVNFLHNPTLGAQALLPAFIVVVVGGLGTFKGTVVAAIVAGIFAEFGAFVNTFYLEGLSALPDMLLFLLLVGILIFQPTGFYGEEEVGGH